jgi:GT2 family glycosyltransferase
VPLSAFIIDNSINPEIESLVKKYHFEYIKPNENLGFGKAHNIGIRKSIDLGFDYHIIVNPDIAFAPNTVSDLLSDFNKVPNIGLMMPRVVYPNGDFQYLLKNLPTPFHLIFRRFLPFRRLKEQLNNLYELKFLDQTLYHDVPTISGCFLMARTKVLKECNGFDPRFFMYLEDVDLCRRIGEKYKIVYSPNATVVHAYAKESYKNGKLLKYHISSAIKYFNKWGWFFDQYRREKNLTPNKSSIIKLN